MTVRRPYDAPGDGRSGRISPGQRHRNRSAARDKIRMDSVGTSFQLKGVERPRQVTADP